MKRCLLEWLIIIFDQEWAGGTCNGKQISSKCFCKWQTQLAIIRWRWAKYHDLSVGSRSILFAEDEGWGK